MRDLQLLMYPIESTALVLIGITASMGYATGFVFGLVWNRLHP